MKLNIGKTIKNIRGEPLLDEKKKSLTIGDMLLNLLSQNIQIKNNREAFWTTEIGIAIADSKDKIEISSEKVEFLKRIVSENKYKDVNTGQREDFFLPFVLGQILTFFDEKIK